MATTEDKMGFVCPEWAIPHWNPLECVVTPCTDGTYCAVDHSLQTTIFVAMTAQDVHDFLGSGDVHLLASEFGDDMAGYRV